MIEALDHLQPLEQRGPGSSRVNRLMHTTARHAEVEMRRVARIDDDRVQLRPVRRAVLYGAHPFPVLRVVVDKRKRHPSDATILGAEQPLWRSARIPDARLTRVTRHEPERVIDRAADVARGRL